VHIFKYFPGKRGLSSPLESTEGRRTYDYGKFGRWRVWGSGFRVAVTKDCSQPAGVLLRGGRHLFVVNALIRNTRLAVESTFCLQRLPPDARLFLERSCVAVSKLHHRMAH